MASAESSFLSAISSSESNYSDLIDNSMHENSTTSLSNTNRNEKIVNFLQQEASLSWIVFGTIGNLLSLFVLLRRKMRIHSTFTYLTLLAVCDTFVLYFGLLRDYLVNKYKFDVEGDILCKLHVFSFYFVLHMASWLLVAVNIDRLIAASFLSLSKKWCTPRTALKVSFFLALSLVLLNSHFIYYVDSSIKTLPTIKNKINSIASNFISSNTNKKNVNNVKYFKNVSSNSSVLPLNNKYSLDTNFNNDKDFFLNLKHENSFQIQSNFYPDDDANELIMSDSVSIFSTLASAKLKIEDENDTTEHYGEPINPYVYQKCIIKANHTKYSYFFQNIFTWIDASAQVILPFIIMVVCNVNIIHKVLLTKNKTNGKNLKRLRKIKGMCVMIVSVSIMFLILEAPILIFICLMQGEWLQPDRPYIELLWTIMNLMMYTNHVINFFSYCMTGTKFRRELLRLLCVHTILKFLSSYKSFQFFSSTANLNQTHIPIRHFNLNHQQNNLKYLKDDALINEKEKQFGSFRVKDAKVNFVVETKFDKFDKVLTKPISLTNRIISKKTILGESAIKACGKKKPSLLEKINSNVIVEPDSNSSLNGDNDSFNNFDENDHKYKDLDSNNVNDNNTASKNINTGDDNDDNTKRVFNRPKNFNDKYSKDDTDIVRSPSSSRLSFRSFSFKKKRKKSKQREVAFINSDKNNQDELDIEIDEETYNIE